MWLAFGILQTFFVVDQCVGKEVHCFGTVCTHEQACRVENTHGHIHGGCIQVKGHGVPHEHVQMGCPRVLQDGHHCFCDTAECLAHFTNAGLQAKANGLQCGRHTCANGEVCQHRVEHGHVFLAECLFVHDVEKHATLGCATLPTDHHSCYCTTDACNKHFYNLVLAQQQKGGPFQCGQQMCADGQFCNIQKGHHDEIHAKCEGHAAHHFENCLPKLLTVNHGCFCKTETCVNHALISIIHGLHLTGIVCDVGQKDNNQICHHGQVCELRHERNGHFTRHCVNSHQLKVCDHAPMIGEVCHCVTQECVYGQFPATTTTQTPTTAQLVTQAPQTNAPTTAVPVVTNGPTTVVPVVPNGPTTAVPVVTDGPTTGIPVVTEAPTTAYQMTTDGLTTSNPGLTNAPTIAHMSTNAFTAAPTTMIPCTDMEDDLFNCETYDQQYRLCSATAGTLFIVANKRCRKYCRICNDGTGSTSVPQTGTPSPTECVDHDPRCVKFQQNLCNAETATAYVIATCPKTCNKCAEYIASLGAPLTTAAPSTAAPQVIVPPKCFTCGDVVQMIPCYSREVFTNDTSANVQCPAGNAYCMTDIFHDTHGNTDIFKRCVSKQTCEDKWSADSANKDYCLQYGDIHKSGGFECHFCCTGDNCNTGLKPASSTLVSKSPGP